MKYRVTRLEADRDPYRVIVRGVAPGGEFITATFRRAEAPAIGQTMNIQIEGLHQPPPMVSVTPPPEFRVERLPRGDD